MEKHLGLPQELLNDAITQQPTLPPLLDFESSADLYSSPQHTPSQQEMRSRKRAKTRRKEDKSNDLTPLGLEEIRNEG